MVIYIPAQIGSQWAVTAAHCVIDGDTYIPYEAAMLRILLGALDKRDIPLTAKYAS